MTSSQGLAFLIASIFFIQVPGPSLLFTIGRALTAATRPPGRGGWRHDDRPRLHPRRERVVVNAAETWWSVGCTDARLIV